MKALVTGDLGFVGRHMRAALEERGWDVIGCDIKRGSLEEDCRRVFREFHTHYDLAVHCAAQIGGREGIEHRQLWQSVNLELDAAFLRWVADAVPGRAVYISSSAVYPVAYQGAAMHSITRAGDRLGRPLHESIVLASDGRFGRPDEIYGWTKLTGEILVEQVRKTGGLITVVRPFSGYGTDQGLDYPFPAFIERAKTRADPFDIWGDGEQIRDWIHIDDLVGAILTAVDLDIDGPFNVASGLPVSFNDLARLICTEVGYTPELQHLFAAPSGVRYRVGDPSKMLEFYHPQVPLIDGIRRALQ